MTWYSGMPSAAAISAIDGLAAERGGQVAAGPDHPVDLLDHVHRDADGAGLVGHGAGDGLADPPGGVGGELVALGVVELLDGADEAEVALLDQVEERHAAAGVALRDADHQAQVRLQQVVLGGPALGDDDLAAVGREVARRRRRSFSSAKQAGLDPLGQLDLLLGGQQLGAADAVQVRPDQVGGDAALVGGVQVGQGLDTVRHAVARRHRAVDSAPSSAGPPSVPSPLITVSCVPSRSRAGDHKLGRGGVKRR